jgi:hypothetical protein
LAVAVFALLKEKNLATTKEKKLATTEERKILTIDLTRRAGSLLQTVL